MGKCEHKYVYMETVRQCASITLKKEWKRIDRFYCEKCLEIKDIIKTAPLREKKPEWFD